MKRHIPLFIGILALGSPFARGEDAPGFPKLKGWDLEISREVYYPDNLWDLIDGAAESYLSYGFVDLHLADYSRKDGILVHAEVYRHGSTDNAFGIYSSERSPEYRFLEIGTQGYQDEGILNFFTGQYYVKLYSTGSGAGLENALQEIGRSISDHLGQNAAWPDLLSAFPDEGKLENRNRYIRENFIGLDFLHSAFTAEYEGGYKLFVIRGRDRDEILEMAKKYLEFTGQEIDPETTDSFTVRDRYNGDIQVALKGRYMAGILNGSGNETSQLELLLERLP